MQWPPWFKSQTILNEKHTLSLKFVQHNSSLLWIYDYRAKLANIEREKIVRQTIGGKQTKTHGNITWHHYTREEMGGSVELLVHRYISTQLWALELYCSSFLLFQTFFCLLVVLQIYVLWPESVYHSWLAMAKESRAWPAPKNKFKSNSWRVMA